MTRLPPLVLFAASALVVARAIVDADARRCPFTIHPRLNNRAV